MGVAVAVRVDVAVEVGLAVAVAVGAGVALGVAVGVGPGVPASWTASCTLLEAASSELNSKPSLLVLSIASERNEPRFAATVEVRSASAQKPTAAPGVNVARVDPLAGLLLKLIAPSLQAVSVTSFTFCAPVDPLVTHIRSFAD